MRARTGLWERRVGNNPSPPGREGETRETKRNAALRLLFFSPVFSPDARRNASVIDLSVLVTKTGTGQPVPVSLPILKPFVSIDRRNVANVPFAKRQGVTDADPTRQEKPSSKNDSQPSSQNRAGGRLHSKRMFKL